MFVRYAVIFGTFLAAYVAQLQFAANVPLSMLAATFMGISAALIGLMPMHDSSHFSITHSPLLWKVCLCVCVCAWVCAPARAPPHPPSLFFWTPRSFYF